MFQPVNPALPAALPWSDIDSGGSNPVPPIGTLVEDGENRPHRRRKAPWLISLTLLLVAAAAGGTFWFLSNEDGATTELVADGNDTADAEAGEDAADEATTTDGNDEATSESDEEPASDDTGRDEGADDPDAGGTASAGATDSGATEDDADSGGVDGGGTEGGGDDGDSAGSEGTGASAENTPDEAVTQMFDAMRAADCDRFPSTISAESRSMMLGDDPNGHRAACQDMFREPNDELSLNGAEVVSEEGESARVSAEVTEFGETYTQELPLVLEDGAWRVDMMAAF